MSNFLPLPSILPEAPNTIHSQLLRCSGNPSTFRRKANFAPTPVVKGAQAIRSVPELLVLALFSFPSQALSRHTFGKQKRCPGRGHTHSTTTRATRALLMTPSETQTERTAAHTSKEILGLMMKEPSLTHSWHGVQTQRVRWVYKLMAGNESL